MSADQYCMHAIVSGRGCHKPGAGSSHQRRSDLIQGEKGRFRFYIADAPTYVGLVELLYV